MAVNKQSSTIITMAMILFKICAVIALSATLTKGDDACSQWSNIAKAMTSRLQTCSNTQTGNCTRLDCSGTVSFAHIQLFNFELKLGYCFGIQLNSCNDPVSIDFYLQVPSKNVSMITRVNEDTLISIPGISISLGPVGKAVPKLNFRFERSADGKVIQYSITLLVYVENSFTTYEVDQLRRSLIDNETLHALPCDKLVLDTAGVPSGAFNSSIGVCGGGNKSSVPTPAPLTTTAKPYTPSATLNKSCGILSKPCGHLEMCDVSKSLCVCLPEAILSQNNDACVGFSQYGSPCMADSECSYLNEECKFSSQQGQKVCQCEDGYDYNPGTESCTFTHPGDHSGHDKQNQTSKSDNSPMDSSDNKVVKHNMPIIVGASLGGAILVGLLVWLVMYYQQRRRRQMLGISSDESRTPMLSSQDEDNLIM
nr:hypothetical protein BgiMline_025066 [Biomphalaria glabrata]